MNDDRSQTLISMATAGMILALGWGLAGMNEHPNSRAPSKLECTVGVLKKEDAERIAQMYCPGFAPIEIPTMPGMMVGAKYELAWTKDKGYSATKVK